MRLVDIDKSIESVKNLIRNGATIEQALDAQPTAYDPEEVVKQLEAQKAVAFITLANTSDAALDASYRNVIAYLDGAIEIVRNGGAK